MEMENKRSLDEKEHQTAPSRVPARSSFSSLVLSITRKSLTENPASIVRHVVAPGLECASQWRFNP